MRLFATLAPVEWLGLHFVYSTPVEWKRFNWAGRARRLTRNDSQNPGIKELRN